MASVCREICLGFIPYSLVSCHYSNKRNKRAVMSQVLPVPADAETTQLTLESAAAIAVMMRFLIVGHGCFLRVLLVMPGRRGSGTTHGFSLPGNLPWFHTVLTCHYSSKRNKRAVSGFACSCGCGNHTINFGVSNSGHDALSYCRAWVFLAGVACDAWQTWERHNSWLQSTGKSALVSYRAHSCRAITAISATSVL